MKSKRSITAISDEVLEESSEKLVKRFIMLQESPNSAKDYKLLKGLFVLAFLEGALKRGEILLEGMKE